MYTITFSRAGDVQGEPRKGERTLAGVLFTGTFIERGIIMIERSGTRFNKGDYFETVIDTEIPSCEVTGFLDGEPVDFSGGGGELTFGESIKKLTNANTVIVFDNIPAEPKCFALTTAFSMSPSDTNNYIASYAKFGDKSFVERYQPSTGDYQDTGATITATFNDNKLTLTSNSLKFSNKQGYVLLYAY